MLIPELIQRAISGQLRFDFIETTITAQEGLSLSSLKGRGHADPVDGAFQFHFLPRGPLLDEWIRPGGYLDPERALSFSIAGIERGSARWTGMTTSLRQIRSAQGAALSGSVKEWSRTDERSVHSSFMRLVIPGHYLYPITVRHLAGTDARTASVRVNNVDITFRDHHHYTEICATGLGELPLHYPAAVTEALSSALDTPVEWVYREWHQDRRRTMTVTLAKPAERLHVLPAAVAETVSGQRYREFWDEYVRELGAILARNRNTEIAS